jgi:pimeloyl-ACP methyl ester carboxylesterase
MTPDNPPYDEFGMFELYARYEGIPWRGRPPVERRTETIGAGQQISGLAWGDGAPRLVLLHGRGQNAHTWDSVAMTLDRPLLALDLPGHGHSSWRSDGDYRPATNAGAIAAVIPRLAPHADAVVGMSLGGLTSIYLAVDHPKLVTRLVIVDITPNSIARHRAMTPAQRGGAGLLGGPASFDSFEEMLRSAAAAVPGRPAESLRPGVLHNSRRLPDGRWAWRYDTVIREGLQAPDPDALWTALSAITAPIMLVRGSRSSHVTDADAAELVRRQPRARVEVAEHAGHSVQSDRAVLLAGLISDFVAAT